MGPLSTEIAAVAVREAASCQRNASPKAGACSRETTTSDRVECARPTTPNALWSPAWLSPPAPVSPPLRSLPPARYLRHPMTRARVSLTGYYPFNTTLDAGVASTGAVASLSRPLSQQLCADLDPRYEYQSWRWHEPVNFANQAAWSNVNAPSIALNFDYAYAQDLVISLKPQVAWAYQSGANTGDALTWGAVAALTKVFSPRLALGIGVSAFHRVDKTQALPFPIGNWQINDTWRIANPFDAGAAGGARIEAVYSQRAVGVRRGPRLSQLSLPPRDRQSDAVGCWREQLHPDLPPRHAQAHERRAHRFLCRARNVRQGVRGLRERQRPLPRRLQHWPRAGRVFRSPVLKCGALQRLRFSLRSRLRAARYATTTRAFRGPASSCGGGAIRRA